MPCNVGNFSKARATMMTKSSAHALSSAPGASRRRRQRSKSDATAKRSGDKGHPWRTPRASPKPWHLEPCSAMSQ
eukprot:4194773-Pyramimonas_sp.AAC.1